MPAGHVIRFSNPDGRQIADVMFVNANDTTEVSGYQASTVFEGFQVTAGSRAWSEPPRLRPIATFLRDNCEYSAAGGLPADDYAWHFWGSHCHGDWYELETGTGPWNRCHTNFIEGFAKIGVSEAGFPLSDLNIFQPTKYLVNDKGFTIGALGGNTAPETQSVEFYAEMDMYVVISNCPVGNQNVPIGEVDCFPLTMAIFDTGVRPVMDYSKIQYVPIRADLHRALLLGTDPGANDKNSRFLTSSRIYSNTVSTATCRQDRQR